MTTTQPMGFVDRIKAAGEMIMTGRPPNPLAQEPQDKPRAALVQELTEWVTEEREFWKPVFKRIREEQEFAAGQQWPGEEGVSEWFDERYKGDVMQQMNNRKTASLYAKNPTPDAKVQERLCFEVWDGKQESIDGAKAILQAATPIVQQAEQAMAAGVMPMAGPPPEIEMAQRIVQDYERGMAEKALYQKVADTARLLISQQWRSQSPEFLVSMKHLVAQVITSRVGYVKVLYRRDEKPMDATQSANVNGLREKLATLKARLEAMTRNEVEADSAEVEKTRLLLQTITKELEQAELPQFENEGVVYDFLPATSVIVDRNCKCLKEFIGAKRICHEMLMERRDAEATYGISLEDAGAVLYDDSGEPVSNAGRSDSDQKECSKVCVWEIQDKPTGLTYTIIDGVKDFVREPMESEPAVNRFWTIVPLVFNVQVVEQNKPQNDVTIYPRSDVRLAMPMQRDINTAGQGLREHRVANRPWWLVNKSAFVEGQLGKLASPRRAHDAIAMQFPADGDIKKHIIAGPLQQIDPAMYDTGASTQQLMMATGMQPANLGAQRTDETATGQAIAEGSRISGDQSNTDDVDWMLGTLAQMTFEMCIQEMTSATVKKLVGRGAVWPDLSKQEIANEIYLEVEAGSSGKPNQAMEAAKAEKIGPLIVQAIQTGDPRLIFLVKVYARILDSKVDVDEIFQQAAAAGGMGPGAMGMPGQPQLAGQPSGPLPAGQPASNTLPPGAARAPGLPPQQAKQAATTAAS